jgi:hypothetical protein
VKGSNTAGVQPNECIQNCHSIRKSLGSPSGRVLLCASASKVNIEICRQFLGKARGYMLGYLHQALEAKDGREDAKSFERNEKIQKIYRSHRDALTFSGEFISQVMRECIKVDG